MRCVGARSTYITRLRRTTSAWHINKGPAGGAQHLPHSRAQLSRLLVNKHELSIGIGISGDLDLKIIACYRKGMRPQKLRENWGTANVTRIPQRFLVVFDSLPSDSLITDTMRNLQWVSVLFTDLLKKKIMNTIWTLLLGLVSTILLNIYMCPHRQLASHVLNSVHFVNSSLI